MRPAAGDGVRVTPELVRAYNDATGVPVDVGIPPLLSIVAGYPLLFDAVAAVTPPELRDRTVHGDHEVTVIRPLRLGDLLRASASVESIRASTPGTSVVVRIEVSDGEGRPVTVHRAVAIVRGAHPAVETGPPVPVPEPEPTEWTATAVVAIAADQPARYAAATGDHNAVHVDPDAARQAGFPGVIAHGLGVFGLALGALVGEAAGQDQAAVRRTRVRFGPPVLPGQELTVQWSGADRITFRTLDAAGAVVLRSGLLDLRRAASADGGRLDLDE
jgi:acyl dehydratase